MASEPRTPSGSPPYRELADIAEDIPAAPLFPRWNLHPFDHRLTPDCATCGQPSKAISKLCGGRSPLCDKAITLCPKTPHFHIKCERCRNRWLMAAKNVKPGEYDK